MWRRLPVVLAVVGVVGGCTVPSSGTPAPVPSAQGSGESTSSAGGDLPTGGAPKVEDPVDASRFEERPCDVLKPEDAETLNVPPNGEQSTGPAGETCLWLNHETKGSLSVVFLSDDEHGLGSVYQEARAVGWAYFESIDDVEQHPAVAFSVKESKPRVDCSVAVGLTDQLVFTAKVSLSDANIGKSDPCSFAVTAAGMMMRTIRGAA